MVKLGFVSDRLSGYYAILPSSVPVDKISASSNANEISLIIGVTPTHPTQEIPWLALIFFKSDLNGVRSKIGLCFT